MTGGIEVIGLVLALYPLVVDAWHARKAVESGVEVNQMIQRLKTEQIIYNEFIQHLVGSSISEAERARLKRVSPGQGNGCWDDPELQSDLKKRLGFEKMQNVLTLVGNIHVLLEAMREGLPGAGRMFTHEHHSASPLKYLRPAKHRQQASLKRHLEDLRRCNHDLQRLLEPGPPGRRKKPRPAAHRFLRRDFTHALDIYNAICNGYKCHCDRPHFANLELPRLNDLEPEPNEGLSYDSDALQLLFSLEDSAVTSSSSNSAIHAAKRQESTNEGSALLEDDEEQLELPDFWTSTVIDKVGGPLVSGRRTSRISIYECQNEQCGAIDDLCKFVRTFGSELEVGSSVTKEELGILYSEEKQYKLQVPRSQDTQSVSLPVVSLHDFLIDQSARKRERMRLALELSYAILQYYSTGWINASWTWRDFSVAKTEGQDPAEAQLFVTTKFYSALRSSNGSPTTSSSLPSEIWTLLGEPILTRLGFALIELAMGKSLSDLRDKSVGQVSMDPDTLDYFTARNILNTGKLLDEQGGAYEAVVRACLDHQFYCQTAYRRLDSRQSSFFQDVEECVIAPLHSMWIETWG